MVRYATVVLMLYATTVLREGFAAKVGGAGETEERRGTPNMVSWNVKLSPEARRPEMPTVAVKGRVKA